MAEYRFSKHSRRSSRRARALITGLPTAKLQIHAKACGAYVLMKPVGRREIDWLLRVGRSARVEPMDVVAEWIEELHLSPQQARILEQLVRGADQERIAETLGVTRNTLKQHVHVLLSQVRKRWPVHDVKDVVVEVLRQTNARNG